MRAEASSGRSEVSEVAETKRDRGRTVIAVLHDLELVRRSFPRTLLLAREPIGWGPTAEVLTDANLKRAGAMPEAWDEHAPWHANGGHAHDHDHEVNA